jgi:hypothetical protein
MACVARAEVVVPADAAAPAPPPVVFVDPPVLVTVEPGVWVVQDSDYPVYPVDDSYSVYRGNIGYSSQSYRGGVGRRRGERRAANDRPSRPSNLRPLSRRVERRAAPGAGRASFIGGQSRCAGRPPEAVRDSRVRASATTARAGAEPRRAHAATGQETGGRLARARTRRECALHHACASAGSSTEHQPRGQAPPAAASPKETLTPPAYVRKGRGLLWPGR